MQWKVMAAIVMCLVWGCAGAPPPTPPAVEARPAPVTAHPEHSREPATPVPMSLSIQLIDGKTREILAGVTATVTSMTGAAKHPSWEGRADAEGGVHVPADIVADVMTVKVKGYRLATVKRSTGRRPKRVITVRLVPE